MEALDITQISSELGVSSKTVNRLIQKFEKNNETKVRHKPDKSDNRRKLYEIQDINAVLDYCGYPLISVPEKGAGNEAPDPPTEVNTERGWMTVSQGGQVVRPRSFDCDRHAATSTVAAKAETRNINNLETYVRHTLGGYVAYRMQSMVGQVDAVFANASQGFSGNADSIFAGEE